MNIKTYIEKANQTRATLENKDLDNYHMAMGISTEAGEILDIFKKYLAYKKPVDWINLQEEIGDLMWYVAGFCEINGFDLNNILETNIEKLRLRYPNKFNSNDAIHRNLEGERQILEKDHNPN